MRPDLVNRIQAAFVDVSVWDTNEVDQFKVFRGNGGQVLIAIGVNERSGRRLLVPAESDSRPKLAVSNTIHARYREVYLEQVEIQDFVQVDCLDPELNPTFDSLLFQLIDRIFDEKQSPLQNLLDAISDWKLLLEAESKRSMRYKIVGLFGELYVFSRLVECDGQGAVKSWLGADGHRHDFISLAGDLEVKTTAGINPNILRVSSTHQFREVGGTPLFLVRLGVAEHPTGDTIPESIGKLTEQGINLEWLWHQVEKVLARDLIRSFDDLRFVVTSELYYRVDDHFPVLEFKNSGFELPPGIVSLSYEIDLNTVEPLTVDQVEDLLKRMATRPGGQRDA